MKGRNSESENASRTNIREKPCEVNVVQESILNWYPSWISSIVWANTGAAFNLLQDEVGG